MRPPGFPDLDLTPPPFSDGLYDWSRGDGTPDSPTHAEAAEARLVADDPDFGTCLELRRTGTLQRLRYMGELPLRPGRFVEISARLKAIAGPAPSAAMAATAGGRGGQPLSDLPERGATTGLPGQRQPVELCAVIGPLAMPGVDLVWGPAALYAHVGLDVFGPPGGVLRIENLCVRDVTHAFAPGGPVLPGFAPADAGKP